MRLLSLAAIVVTLVLLGVAGCGGGGGGDASLRVLLTDAPSADVSAAHVHITAVQAVQQDGGVIDVLTDADIPDDVELISLAGAPQDLGTETLPAGQYEQLRLKLSTEAGANWIISKGERFDLTVPSGSTSGVKLVTGPFTLVEGGTITVLLDFDAAASIHETGSGKWIMRPVIHASVVSSGPSLGTVAGTVKDPEGAAPVPPAGQFFGVFLLDAGLNVIGHGEVSTVDGSFSIPSVLVGSYTLELSLTDDAWALGTPVAFSIGGGADVTSTPVAVTDGATTTADLVVGAPPG